MTVYVDLMQKTLKTSKKWPYATYCHMIADNKEELIKFSAGMGLLKVWYQKLSFPHFDLTQNMRNLAVSRGAKELTLREFVYKMREIKNLKSNIGK